MSCKYCDVKNYDDKWDKIKVLPLAYGEYGRGINGFFNGRS